ncbi:MAG: NADH-quinone oxidoreductase subunit J [Bacteroidetes bacterium]|nr:NADH-quinone oxidoreductase subunit J [Bacteroidota bacterium]MBS1926492.1 NADH-quinone oxidoreductase subunit J [Bacteroidota bacterium]MCC6693725.1 NADH-quinone oxidoreductase subunit J [Chitinophagaceae bacterium]HMU23438.1 NADH-quinone oxidoreductase subunit J [Ferruginibacter sp.]
MTAYQITFYGIAALILVTGFLSVTTRKIFRSAIWLLLSLIGVAGLYFWMEVEFIAAVQIAVYVGGIVVLIIFAVFLTQQSGNEMPKAPPARTLFAVLSALFGMAFSIYIICNIKFPVRNEVLDASVSKIGTAMLHTGKDGYALPFEVVSILLLAAMVGCIVIAMKNPGEKIDEKIINHP